MVEVIGNVIGIFSIAICVFGTLYQLWFYLIRVPNWDKEWEDDV